VVRTAGTTDELVLTNQGQDLRLERHGGGSRADAGRRGEVGCALRIARGSGRRCGDGPIDGGGAERATAAAPAAAKPAMAIVDVEVVLVEMAAKNPQKLNWRTSIVDLMKLLDLDSSLTARKELATELGYTGDTGDSAAMNVWLHKQVMKKLAESGGKVPDELKT
jgi:hypothetical protein